MAGFEVSTEVTMPWSVFLFMYGTQMQAPQPSARGGGAKPSPPPPPPCANDQWNRAKKLDNFIRPFYNDAVAVATLMNTKSEFVLAHAAEESGWNTGAVAVNAGNYFGMKAGSNFGGTTGKYRYKGDDYGKYSPPGFLNSGRSLANSGYGSLMSGSKTISDYLAPLTTNLPKMGGTYNPDPDYAKRITNLVKDILYWLPCR